ncbi:B-type flagellin [Polystyrenella longa]|uniref:Flagellin n=1 Tax=Polystyrenella longa TaxID=2528007 RepID=A0A518CRD6_9PLAN|nr:flagellin [Polystyrenella longa]QDU81764.1 B-type flagellin [Polystyrenella longa]
MTRINTNVASLRGLRSLNKANDLLGTSLTRLSTGLQINSGKDNPAGLIAGETLRAQITTIEQSIKNSNRANNVLSTADSAIGEISGLLNQVRGLVQEGLNDGALSDEEISANQLQIDAALSAINRISANTTFAGSKLIDGSKGFTTQLSTADAAELSDFQINEAVFGSSPTIEVVAQVNQTAEKAELNFNGGALTSKTTFEVSGSRGSQVLFFDSASSTANIADAVNAATGVTGVTATATNGSVGTLTVNTQIATVAGTVDLVSTGANNDLTFTDARATGTQGDFTNKISVTFSDPSANSQSLSLSISGNDITVNLATNGNGTITSTADDVSALISGNATANALVSVADTAGNDGTGLVEAIASTQVGDGVDQQDAGLVFTDARGSASGQALFTNAISVQLADPSGNNQALSATVTTEANGQETIVINLATNGDGTITSTADDVEAFINGNETVNALISAVDNGNGTDTLAAAAAGTVSDGVNSSLTFTSSEYGSNEFVDINVLDGTFSTTLNDDTTVATRDSGVDIGVTINGQTAQTNGLKASVKTANLDVSLTLAEGSNSTATSSTITITGGGSLFQIGQEVSSQGQIGIGIDAINTARLGGSSGKLYELGSGAGKSLLDVGPSVPGSTLVDIVDEAISRVNTLRGRIGALQKNVIETNISTLSVALENITEARSSIVDADFAIETANLTRAQILSQAGTSVLSIANQTPSQVLALLG